MSTPSSKLFKPLSLGPVELNHRIVMAPLTRLRADDAHVQSPMAVEYYSQRASTPGGLIIAEATVIAPEHGGGAHTPGIWTQEHIERWKTITDAVHAKGCHIFCQLISIGRVADPDMLQKEGGFPVISSGDIPCMTEGPGAKPRPLSKSGIATTVAAFAQAAKNSIAAGFDGVEVHGANGYLIDQFVQDVSNNRNDEYGGSVENRSRFAIEVAQAMVEAIGAERVGFRLSPFSVFQGMKMKEPIPQFSHLVQKLEGLRLAYLHLIESRVINNVDCENQESLEPFLKIWGHGRPVLVAGGFRPDLAYDAVDNEYAEYQTAVVFGRHFLANPDLPYRIQHGIPLNKYDRSTFYTPEQAQGYLDYPYSSEWLKEATVAA